MRRFIAAVLVLVGLVITIPSIGFLTSRNALTSTCGSGSFQFEGSGPVPVANPGLRFEARIASWNAAAANSTDGVVAGLRRIGKDADLIGVQELHPEGQRKAVESKLGRTWGISKANNAVQILWRLSRYERLAEGSEKVFDLEPMEYGVSGGALGPKSVQWVQLRDKTTGAVIFLANHHIVPSIDRNGHRDTSNPKRLALMDQQLDKMVALIGALRQYGPVFTTGDLNIDERLDAQVKEPTFPFVRMGSAGLISSWQALGYPLTGTHGGRRLIDSVWGSTGTTQFVSQRILPLSGSDHSAVLTVARNGSTGDIQAVLPDAAAAVTGTPGRLSVPGPTPQSSMSLDGEQKAIASQIIQVGKTGGIPTQGWIVALATALQESQLRNLNYGDRDSLGPFQQRPSQGWGTRAQITEVTLSTKAFYGIADHTNNAGLVDIQGWQSMSITRAAQAVQRSGFPDAYAKWEPAARSIVDLLAGVSSNAAEGSCGDPAGAEGQCPPTGMAAERGLTPDALLVIRCGHEKFPIITSIGGVRPDSLPDHPSGRAVDFMIPDYKTSAGKEFGWQVARWLRANHRSLGVQYVIFDAKIWNVLRDAEGWRPYNSVTGAITDSSMHYNHVHVTVFGTQGSGPAKTVVSTSGRWVMPLPAGSYTVGCDINCYPGHTGQDFRVPTGTEVRSSNDGAVIRSEALRSQSGAYRSYGNLIVIQVADQPSLTIWYAHLSTRRVQVGDHVNAGRPIGNSGSTGHSDGPHLHYEIRIGGKPTDPMPILKANGVTP